MMMMMMMDDDDDDDDDDDSGGGGGGGGGDQSWNPKWSYLSIESSVIEADTELHCVTIILIFE